jgi:hypothetical protein
MISLTPPKHAIQTITLMPKVESSASDHPDERTASMDREPSPLAQPRMNRAAKNSSRDMKPDSSFFQM